ncbi:SDR family oxidoreductase [Candidatus Roizmanbacteria bacterium]|nr:SDR family oxidoreductase [Candidatus Roizmanbacteria bacterium]
MVKIAVTGSTGLIGSRIIELLKNDFEFVELTWPKFDITQKETIWDTLKNLNFDLLLHLAAYTNVDEAEEEPGKSSAFKINVEGTKNIFAAVIKRKKKFIYVSTDFVFDGKNPPYFENSIPNPLSYYAQTKLEGEKYVQQQAMIVRFSYPYRTYFKAKRDFFRVLKYWLEEKKGLGLVQDSLITPTFIDDIAFALKYLFLHYSPEIFHIVGGDALSPYEAGILIAKQFKLDKSLIKATTYQHYFGNKSKRPQFSEIKSKKNNFYRMKTFEEGLIEIKKQTMGGKRRKIDYEDGG